MLMGLIKKPPFSLYIAVDFLTIYLEMEIQDFIQHFAAQFDEVDASEFQPKTVFKTLKEWSSLAALSVIAMADEEYNVSLKGNDIKNASTIEDLFNLVQAKSGQ